MRQIFLLGRFDVQADGQPVTWWGGRQARDVVKMLAAAAPQPLTRDELAACLWEKPSHLAERNLKVLVSRARRALGDAEHNVIMTTEAGYALNDTCWIDTREMERLMANGAAWERAGRLALAEASYRAALDLYRGPLLAEDRYADWVAPYRASYHRLYTEVLLALGDLLLRRDDREAIVLAGRLVDDDPYSDIAIQALMTALANNGDVSAALATYARFHKMLRDELGTAPGLDTITLHTALLRGEVPRSWPRPTLKVQALVHPEEMLVGREHELSVLEDALDSALSGHPMLLILKGVAGIGKSRLLQALQARASECFFVAAAAGRESERYLPFQLLTEALRSLDSAPDTLRTAMGPYADALATLVPELQLLANHPIPSPLSQVTRRRLLEGVLYLIRTLAEQRPVLLSLDDLHWADPSTVDALAFCLSRLRTSRVLCAVAVRRDHPNTLVDMLDSLPIAQTIDLAPLSPEAIRQMVDAVSPEVAEQIVVQSEGVPFYAVEFVRSLAESNDPSIIPSGIRQAMEQRVARLSVPGRRLLEAAAVLGDPFTLEAVKTLAGLRLRAAVDALADLEARYLIVSAGGPSPSYHFVHDLMRRSIYEGMGTARQSLLHGLAADLLAGAGPAVIAHHAQCAGRPAQAARLFREAGDAALARFATTEADELYGAALAAADAAQLDQATRLELLDRLGQARAARGDYEAAATAHRTALELAGDDVAVACQTLRLGWIAYYQHQPERAAVLATTAANCGDATIRGEGLLLQAKVAHSLGQVALAATQVALAARLVDPAATPDVRALEVAVANHLGRFEEAVLRFSGAVDPLRRQGHLRPLASLMLHGGIALAGKGEYVRALAILKESAVYCQHSGSEHLQSRVPNTLGSIYRELGQHSRAAELHAESIALATKSGFAEALAHALVGCADLAMDAGDTTLARRHVEEARPIVHDPLVSYSWRARLRWYLASSRLALMEQQPEAALCAADAALTEAARTASPKYQILALLARGAVLGPTEGVADGRAALACAQRLDAGPLIWQAALALSLLVPRDERERLHRFALRKADELAATLPDDLRRSFMKRSTITM